MKKLLLGILFAFMITTTAAAAPSINGSTGQINNPSADVLQEGKFAIGYYHLKDEGGVGVFNFSPIPKLEVGVAGFRFDDNRSNKTLINGKLELLPETILTPGLAVGVEDINASRERTAYAVASKALPFGFRIHAGVGNGRYDGVFASLEKTINPLSVITGNNTFPATTLIVEYDGKNMNYGARMSVVPGLKLDAGWRGQNHGMYFGASFTN